MPLQQHLTSPDITSKEGQKLFMVLEGMGRSLSKKFDKYRSQRLDKDDEWTRAVHQ